MIFLLLLTLNYPLSSPSNTTSLSEIRRGAPEMSRAMPLHSKVHRPLPKPIHRPCDCN